MGILRRHQGTGLGHGWGCGRDYKGQEKHRVVIPGLSFLAPPLPPPSFPPER